MTQLVTSNQKFDYSWGAIASFKKIDFYSSYPAHAGTIDIFFKMSYQIASHNKKTLNYQINFQLLKYNKNFYFNWIASDQACLTPVVTTRKKILILFKNHQKLRNALHGEISSGLFVNESVYVTWMKTKAINSSIDTLENLLISKNDLKIR